MKQQIMAIHGGTSFDSYDDYLRFLRTREINLEKLKQGDDWRTSLAGNLGDGYEVLLPKMPNGTNVRYLEWKLWFERCVSFLQAESILIGHSLGGIFLAKYLAENIFPQSIKATFIVAAPFDATSTVESLSDFILPASLKRLAAQGGDIYLVYCKDDPVVPFKEIEKYRKELPEAHQIIFEDRGHFNQKEFPELVRLIKDL